MFRRLFSSIKTMFHHCYDDGVYCERCCTHFTTYEEYRNHLPCKGL